MPHPSVEPLSLAQLSGVEPLLTPEERALRDQVRRFVREHFLDRAAACFERAEFPRDLVLGLGALGVLGGHLSGYGCAGMGAVAHGLALAELEFGDSALRSFVSVQGSLCMQAIHRFGAEAQKDTWLPRMARGEVVGSFGLTEHESGSDPASMRTTAERTEAGWILRGGKMWITNAPFADLFVVWAKVVDSAQEGEPTADAIRGFVVPATTPGVKVTPIHGKISLRGSSTGELALEGAVVDADAMLPLARGLGAPLSCLNQARFGIAWGVLGAARHCFESALAHARTRVQFGVPIGQKQLVQSQLVDMASEIVKAEVLAYHLGRAKEQGTLLPQQVSLAKRNNVAVALEVARTARGLLGARGILTETSVIRHMVNLESVSTYEGTHEVHTLILGKALTGLDAF